MNERETLLNMPAIPLPPPELQYIHIHIPIPAYTFQAKQGLETGLLQFGRERAAADPQTGLQIKVLRRNPESVYGMSSPTGFSRIPSFQLRQEALQMTPGERRQAFLGASSVDLSWHPRDRLGFKEETDGKPFRVVRTRCSHGAPCFSC